jgi:hypothetical protein
MLIKTLFTARARPSRMPALRLRRRSRKERFKHRPKDTRELGFGHSAHVGIAPFRYSTTAFVHPGPHTRGGGHHQMEHYFECL